MLNLMRKDLMLIFSIKKSLISIILFFPLMILILGEDSVRSLYPLMILSYGYILTSIPFKYEMRDKPHMLVQSLPIRKKDIVISKYIFVFINYVKGFVLAAVFFKLFSILGINTEQDFSISLVKKTLFIFILNISVSLPAYFRLSPRLSNIVNVIIFILIINIFTIGGNALENIYKLINSGGIVLPVILAIVYLISMEISIWLYETRSLH